MSTSMTPPAAETLLAHTGWMRSLARSLVRDDAQADDVVQDAVVAALTQPPRDRTALPAWLASVVRNRAREFWRGEGRRGARERVAARGEAEASTVDVVARAEEHGLVVRAVLALDEPYRTTLLLRFYEDLPPREIARRLGVPVETVRSRVRRALEQLRTRLDHEHGGDGRAWRAALLPLAAGPLPWTEGATQSGASAASASPAALVGGVAMATGTTIVVGLVALAVGAGVGFLLGDDAAEVAALRRDLAVVQVYGAGQRGPSDGAQDDRARRDTALRAAESRLEETEQRAKTLEAELTAARAELAFAHESMAASRAAVRQALGSKAPQVSFAEFGVLNDVDWSEVGENLNAMAPLIGEMVAAAEAGKGLPPETTAKLGAHNAPLVGVALKVMGKVPGTGANGSFTHPAFMVNAIASTLEAAGKPLSPEQATALERKAREFAAEDARRLGSYDAMTFGIGQLIDEAALRHRFFEAAMGLLTDDQHATLRPPQVRGRASADLFSEGLLWATVVHAVTFDDRQHLAQGVAGAIVPTLKFADSERQAAAREIVAAWANELPGDLLTLGGDPSATTRGLRNDFLAAAAEQTHALLRRLVDDLLLEGEAADAARAWRAVIVPIPQDLAGK